MAAVGVVGDRAGQRSAHLDRLKVVLTAGVIVAHAAMSYGAAGTWIYQEDSLSGPARTILSASVGGGILFVIGLFFLIAGLLTSDSLRRRDPRRFLLSRVRRLGIPVVAYAVIVWPVLQWWIDDVRGQAPTLWAFYRQQFSGTHWQARGTGPMWFLEILLLVTVGWCVWRGLVPARPTTVQPATAVLVATGTVAVVTFLVRAYVPIDSAQFLDLHVWLWPQSMTLFVLGAVGGERGWWSPVPARVRRLCRGGVALAAVLIAALVLLSDGPEPFTGGWHWQAAGLAGCEGLVAVGSPLLILDWSRRHVVGYRRHERGLAGAAYGAFVLQGPVLVGLALSLRSLGVGGDLKFVLLAVLAVAGSFAVGALATAAHRPRGRRVARATPVTRRSSED